MSDLRPARHEKRDVNVPGLLISAGGLTAAVVIAFIVAWWTFDYLSARDKESKSSAFPLAAQERGRLPPEPRLEEIDRQEEKKGDMRPKELNAADERILEGYGWVDQKAGVARIPIRRAMKIIVDINPMPTRTDGARGRELERERQRPSASNSGRAFEREE
jgi:hypothetical protein